MTPFDLRAWQVRMGHTYDTAAAALGVHRATYARWLRADTVPLIVELACAELDRRGKRVAKKRDADGRAD